MKKKSNRSIIILIGIVITLILLGGILIQNKENPNHSFLSKIKQFFNVEQFSVIGENRNCDTYARETFYYNANALINVNSYDAGCRYSLIDVYDQSWNPRGEYKDSLYAYCGSSNGCIVEIYCCPHPECSSDSDCRSWVGTGSRCVTSTANDPHIDYEYSSYKYCTAACTGPDITCWRISSNTCEYRHYDCGYSTYPNCPSTYPYTSKTQCENNLCSSHSSYKCYDNDVYWYDSCGKLQDKKAECGTLGCSNNACNTVTCKSGADANNDKNIDLSELWVYANNWLNDKTSRSILGEVIMDWSQGCGNW